ncbi:MAG: hypothetical protein ACXADF_18340, partial [Candidatus Thorarchaeota archaeon]
MSGSRVSSLVGILIVVIIVGAGFYIGFLASLDSDEPTTTSPTSTTTATETTTPFPTNTTTTTDSTTTTTTTTTVQQETLYVLTRFDVAVYNVFESAFLASEFAIENNIGDIVWRNPDVIFWDDLIDMG